MLFTNQYGVIRDPKRNGKEVCRFKRKGGLYVTRLKMRNPKYTPKRTKGFQRQGMRR